MSRRSRFRFFFDPLPPDSHNLRVLCQRNSTRYEKRSHSLRNETLPTLYGSNIQCLLDRFPSEIRKSRASCRRIWNLRVMEDHRKLRHNTAAKKEEGNVGRSTAARTSLALTRKSFLASNPFEPSILDSPDANELILEHPQETRCQPEMLAQATYVYIPLNK